MTRPAFPSPATAPERLPELVTVQCQACLATGLYDYAVTADGDLVRLECPVCLGDAVREVCGGCGQEPEVVGGFEQCACVTTVVDTCDCCEREPQALEGLCKACIQEAAENYAHELNLEAAEAELKMGA